jgi:sortase A
MRWLRSLERLLLFFGMLMLAFYVAAGIHRAVLSNAEIQRFEDWRRATQDEPHEVTRESGTPDFNLWSQQRIKDYQESLAARFAPPIAILRIPKIHLKVAVLEGTDELTLNRGVGHIAGTADPGESGNVAVAGHRDGFFRGLKDVSLGEKIELDTPENTLTYVVDRITVVAPSEVSVLAPTPREVLTLVTCYPFYFVGSAPKRYIVQASLTDSAPASAHASGPSQPK